MACHNREKFVTEAVESILNQTYQNFELLILDDNSSDLSFSIAKSYAEKDKRIKLNKNNYNKGVGFTKKTLLDQSI